MTLIRMIIYGHDTALVSQLLVNHLKLNIRKTKELVVQEEPPSQQMFPWTGRGWRWWTPTGSCWCIWTINWTSQTKLGSSTRRDRACWSFWGSGLSMCPLCIASVIFFAAVCWGGGVGSVGALKLNKLVMTKPVLWWEWNCPGWRMRGTSSSSHVPQCAWGSLLYHQWSVYTTPPLQLPTPTFSTDEGLNHTLNCHDGRFSFFFFFILAISYHHKNPAHCTFAQAHLLYIAHVMYTQG